ncbi:uncharacterized protein LOC115312713 [Ixodes scapularis]|uniref:uncharacterized protein LOC115312713 n=1 Tax=Ixodes scapularis TaxID=6945 RepID=UPI001C380212|nr:uncharacterized protein LOC115312713 [Ixodes scapularis]
MPRYCCVPRCTQSGYKDVNGNKWFHLVHKHRLLSFNSRQHLVQPSKTPWRVRQTALVPKTWVKVRAGSEEEHALDRHDSDQDIIRLQTPAPRTAQETEIDELQQELKKAKARILYLEREVALLKEKCSKNESSTNRFCVEKFKDSDEDFLFYTGLPCYGLFHILLSYLGPASCDMNVEEEGESEQGATRGRPSSLSTENQLFLVLVRLRLGLFQQDLAHRFNVHQSTVSRLFTAWINFMFLRLSELSIWSSRSVIDRTMPEGFKQKYPKTRVVIDSTELKCEVPSSFVLQSETFSPYKSANTFKGLVGIAPDGAVTFVSPLATGCISDKELVRKSGFLLLPFEDGDVVMADKGFTIADLLEPLNVHLNIPPFLRNGQFSEAEILETEAIASLRIHVERRIQRIKSFHIFDRRIPLTIAPVINQLWTVCVLLTNFQTPLIKEH